MRKILIISALDIWSMGKNKGAPSLWRTLKGYADAGWKVYFVTSNKDKNSIYNIHKNIKIARFDCRCLKKLFNIKKIGFFTKSIWWFYFQIKAFLIGYQIAKKEKIDVFYGYENYSMPAAKLLSMLFRAPVISRFQGTMLASWVGEKFWKIRFWQLVLAYKMPVDLLIMTNDGTRGDWVLQQLGVDMSKIKFWINGVNKNIYIPNFNKDQFKESLSIKKNKKILLTVSRLEKWKRVDRIIKVMSEILKKYSDIKLLIIGEGSEKKGLEDLASKLQITNYVKFLGALPHQELKNYYNLADIFVSLYDISNIGNPLLEAMSCGKCIVTLDIGDTNKFIFNGQNGVLLKMGELNKLPEIIVNLIRDDDLRKILGKNAKEFAYKNFWIWEERIQAEINTISNLLKNND